MSSSMFNFKSSGFKTDDRRFTTKKTQVRPIGLKTPLSVDESDFETHDNAIKQISDNFRNLILTNNGERLGRFEFGSNLKSIVFEYSNSPNFVKIVEDTVVEITQTYIPSIQILSVESVNIDKNVKNDLNQFGVAQVKIMITYIIPKFRSKKLGLEITLNVGG